MNAVLATLMRLGSRFCLAALLFWAKEARPQEEEDEICRICASKSNVMTKPDEIVPFGDNNYTCAGMDWWVGDNLSVGSFGCAQIQSLYVYCGCQEPQENHDEEEEEEEENDDDEGDEGVDGGATSGNHSDMCTLCPNGENPMHASKEFSSEIDYSYDEETTTTCSDLAAYLATNVTTNTTTCSALRENFAEYCGCALPQSYEKCNWCPRGITKPDNYLVKDFYETGVDVPCQDADTYLVEFGDGSQLCSDAQIANFRCGCSEGMAFDHPLTKMTMSKFRWFVWMPRVTGFLSLLGSCFILQDIVRDPKKLWGSTQHQILVGMSLVDIWSSLMYVLGPIAAVQYDENGLWEGNPGAIGTTQTCKAQGFFIQLGLAVTFFNVSLSVYYYLVIARSWREQQFQRTKFKYVLLLMPLVLGLVLAVRPLEYYKSLQGFCDFAFNDLVYYAPDWFVGYAERKRSYRTLVSLVIVPLSISILLVTLFTLAAYCHVRKIHKRAMQWRMEQVEEASSNIMAQDDFDTVSGARDSRRPSEQRQLPSTVDLVFRQSLCYLLGFYLTWPILLTFLCLPLESVTYAMRLTVVTLLPFQGLHNAVVYVRPKIVARRLKQKKRNLEASVVVEFKTPSEENRKVWASSNEADAIDIEDSGEESPTLWASSNEAEVIDTEDSGEESPTSVTMF